MGLQRVFFSLNSVMFYFLSSLLTTKHYKLPTDLQIMIDTQFFFYKIHSFPLLNSLHSVSIERKKERGKRGRVVTNDQLFSIEFAVHVA